MCFQCRQKEKCIAYWISASDMKRSIARNPKLRREMQNGLKAYVHFAKSVLNLDSVKKSLDKILLFDALLKHYY